MEQIFDAEDEFSDETTSETESVITANEESEELLAEETFDASEDSNGSVDEVEVEYIEYCQKCGEESSRLLTINDIRQCQACANKIQAINKAIKESSKKLCRVVLDKNDVHDYIGGLHVAVKLEKIQVPKTIHEATHNESDEPELIVLDDDDDGNNTGGLEPAIVRPETAAESAKTTLVAENEPTKTNPIEIESAASQPAKTESAATQPVKAESAATQPAKAESAATQPVKAESAATQPAKTESAATQPAKAESVATQPAKVESAATQPAKAESAATQPVKVETGMTQSVVAKPEPVQPLLQVDDKSKLKEAEQIVESKEMKQEVQNHPINISPPPEPSKSAPKDEEENVQVNQISSSGQDNSPVAASPESPPAQELEKSYKCRICDNDIDHKEDKKFKLHLILFHFKDDLLQRYQSDVRCQYCPKDLTSDNALAKIIHVGVAHHEVVLDEVYEQAVKNKIINEPLPSSPMVQVPAPPEPSSAQVLVPPVQAPMEANQGQVVPMSKPASGQVPIPKAEADPEPIPIKASTNDSIEINHDLSRILDDGGQPMCNFCNRYFPDHASVGKHIDEKHKEECKLCQAVFIGDFDEHLVTEHFAMEYNMIISRIKFPKNCQGCPNVVMKDREGCIKHMNQVHDLARKQYDLKCIKLEKPVIPATPVAPVTPVAHAAPVTPVTQPVVSQPELIVLDDDDNIEEESKHQSEIVKPAAPQVPNEMAQCSPPVVENGLKMQESPSQKPAVVQPAAIPTAAVQVPISQPKIEAPKVQQSVVNQSVAVQVPIAQPKVEVNVELPKVPQKQPMIISITEIYQCLMCRNQNVLSNFQTETFLRIHVAKKHFKTMISSEIKVNMKKFPICPYPNCDSMFNKVENVFEHFTLNHKDMEYPTLDKCNMKCNQQGCFKGPFETFDDLLEHSEREHNFYVKNLLKKLQMELTLIPLPMKNSQSVMNNENVTAKEKKAQAIKDSLFYHHKAGFTKKSTGTAKQSLLKSHLNSANVIQKPTVIQAAQVPIQIQSPTLGSVQVPKSEPFMVPKFWSQPKIQTPTIEAPKPAIVISTQPGTSLLKQFRKKQHEVKTDKVSGELRAPSLSDIHRFYIEIISNSKCVICHEKMYDLSENNPRRQTLAYRHAYRSHVNEELKFHLLQSQISKNIQNMLTCPECPETHDTYASILEHFCVNHKKVQESFWQLVHFKTTFLSQAMANPSTCQNQDPNEQDQELAKFGQENTYSINEAKKLMTIPMNETRIQPMACFLMSEDLEHCHECWKVRIGQGTIGSICQFEGFRKVKRVPTDWKHPFAFEASGFLDPFKDPNPKDLDLWTLPTKDIAVKDAKTILLRAGDQFCNLAKEELDKIEAYKKNGQNAIWKRLQYKVREMCDVCSTSLFNAHFTCTECGIIVCIDCHEVRCKGNLQYQGSSGTYKSRKRVSGQNFDSHFWPFCKEKGNLHQPEKLILTQVICGDVLKDMYDRVHSLKKTLNMKLDCLCCKKAEVEEIKSPETVQAAPPKKTSPPPKKTKKKEILPTKFTLSFDKCPVCQKYPLKKDSPLAPALHMLKHFGKDLEAKIKSKSESGAYTCPQCDWQDDEKVNTMLHLALDHNELENVFKVWKMKKYTIKNIVLKVDKAESCKQCGMDYNEHQMGFPEIRKHLNTHFRNDIHELFGIKGGNHEYKCNFQVGCEFETHDKGRLTDHIGIFHRYLDTIVDKLEVKPKKKKMSLSDYAKKNSIQEPIKTEKPEDQVKKEPAEPMVIKDFSCPICDIWDSKENIRKHAMEHFELELKELVKDREFNDAACPNCPFELALDHLALEHGWIDKLLNDQPMIVEKRKEYFENHALPKILNRKRRSSVDLTLNKRIKNDFKCLLCGTVLPEKDLDYAINHFATHVWVQLQKYYAPKNQKDDLFNCFMRNLPLDSYVSHYGLRQNSKEHQQFMNGITSKIREVINEKWCCICQKSQQLSNNQHKKCDQKKCKFPKSLSDVDKIEELRSVISPEKSRKMIKGELEKDENGREFCEYCHEGFQTKDYYKHMALGHLKDLFVSDAVPKYATPDRKCKLCNFFKAANEEDLILHLAEKHKQLERYVYMMNEKEPSGKHDIFKEMIEKVVITEDPKTLIYRCHSCKSNYKDLQTVREHVKNHFKQNWPLPAMQPYICPECFYEAATYLSLFKHVGTTHGEELKSIWNKEVAAKNLVPFAAIGGKNHPVMQSKSYKKHFTIVQPSQDTKVKKPPKVKFVDFLQKQFKDVQRVETHKEEPEKMEEDVVEEANIHPPSRVTCRHLNLEQYTPHRWLCDGRLLMLEDPKHENNQRLFQEQWIRGQPVIMCNATEHLNRHLWHPEAFLKDFGHLKHDLVNCLSGKVIPKAQLTEFWKGFQTIRYRLRDMNGTPMLLKLKDWPPTEDIASYMPNRFNDLVNAYPLPEYTHREGALNLASYLPDYCLKPELGPKMYIAYGSALYSNKGSTNLHIDMSDAVNMLVYVGFPTDGNMQENAKEVFKEVDKAGCDILMKRRVRSRNILPGALWHIFHPSDTCKIRDFLNKVALEKGVRLDPHDDPIHDQSTYLDGHLRRRLYTEYGVKGYAIVQCAGDTVFIPAGGAHQVRNLHNCIKVAEDFVSPENISHCLHLTNEFRHLTEWHTNHEDKLQIKTILYHAIKTALTALEEKK